MFSPPLKPLPMLPELTHPDREAELATTVGHVHRLFIAVLLVHPQLSVTQFKWVVSGWVFTYPTPEK